MPTGDFDERAAGRRDVLKALGKGPGCYGYVVARTINRFNDMEGPREYRAGNAKTITGWTPFDED